MTEVTAIFRIQVRLEVPNDADATEILDKMRFSIPSTPEGGVVKDWNVLDCEMRDLKRS